MSLMGIVLHEKGHSLKVVYCMLAFLYNFQNHKIKRLKIHQCLPGMNKGKEHGVCGYK